MDLGVFRRKKETFWAWIVLPILSVVVAYHALNVYCRFVEQRLHQRQAILGILDDVEQRMNVAKDVVCGFAMIGDGGTVAAEDINSRITDLARRHDFTINALQVKDPEKAPKAGAHALLVSVKGEGNILALLQFLNELQNPQRLTVVDSASMYLRTQGDGGSAVYETELTVRCFLDALQGGRDA